MIIQDAGDVIPVTTSNSITLPIDELRETTPNRLTTVTVDVRMQKFAAVK